MGRTLGLADLAGGSLHTGLLLFEEVLHHRTSRVVNALFVFTLLGEVHGQFLTAQHDVLFSVLVNVICLRGCLTSLFVYVVLLEYSVLVLGPEGSSVVPLSTPLGT